MEKVLHTTAARNRYIRGQLAESAETKQKMFDACAAGILEAFGAIVRSYKKGGKVLLCGNGGSAADSQHIATELVIRMSKPDRPALAALALTTDSSMLTAGGNDLGFGNIFARQVEGLGKKGDVLIAISTSGASENVNRAIMTAKRQGLTVVGFLGKGGGRAKKLVDIAIVIPSHDTQRIQEGHITVAHILCGLLEREMFG
jgi:D-sedoheptulose 7-phosphate isomerase